MNKKETTNPKELKNQNYEAKKMNTSSNLKKKKDKELPWWVELLFVQIGLPDKLLIKILKAKKTSKEFIKNEKKSLTYMTQLNSYAIMFEQPDQNYLKLNPVKNLGIFCFEPSDLKLESTPTFVMATKYFEILRNDDLYFKFMTDVIDFLEGDIPSFNNNCSICNLKLQTFPK